MNLLIRMRCGKRGGGKEGERGGISQPHENATPQNSSLVSHGGRLTCVSNFPWKFWLIEPARGWKRREIWEGTQCSLRQVSTCVKFDPTHVAASKILTRLTGVRHVASTTGSHETFGSTPRDRPPCVATMMAVARVVIFDAVDDVSGRGCCPRRIRLQKQPNWKLFFFFTSRSSDLALIPM